MAKRGEYHLLPPPLLGARRREARDHGLRPRPVLRAAAGHLDAVRRRQLQNLRLGKDGNVNAEYFIEGAGMLQTKVATTLRHDLTCLPAAW